MSKKDKQNRRVMESVEALNPPVHAEVPETEEKPVEAVSEAPETNPETTSAKPVTEEPAPKKGRKDRASFDQKVKAALEGDNQMVRMVLTNLQTYLERMQPGQLRSQDELGTAQLLLWRTIVLSMENEADFKECFDWLVAFAKEYGDEGEAFHDNYLFRGMEAINLDSKTVNHFQAMLCLLQLLGRSKSKAEVKKLIDLDRVLNEEIFSNDARNRVMQYCA